MCGRARVYVRTCAREARIVLMHSCRLKAAPQSHMSKTLVIAEKPSVAQDIVRALTPVVGKFEKAAEYFENAPHACTGLDEKPRRIPDALRAALMPFVSATPPSKQGASAED